jgi:hypothetical protein
MLWTCHAGYFHLHLISDSTGETLITSRVLGVPTSSAGKK